MRKQESYTMVKIALINPGKDKQYSTQEPLNLGFLASYLEKHNIEVKIIDQLAEQKPQKEIKKFNPTFVGITGTTPLINDAFEIADWCMKHNYPVIFGGVHASIQLNDTDSLYTVVKGEGEKALLGLVKGEIPLNGIIEGEYIKNLDEIPPPARHLIDMNFYMRSKDRISDSYLYFVPKHTKVASILTSRGCPFECTFCWNSTRKVPVRMNSAPRVIAEMEILIKQYEAEALFFIEDNFFLSKIRVRKICEELIAKRIEIMWGANARVDGINLKLLQTAKQAGCEQITFGFESGSQKILNILNKQTTVEQNRKAIEICKEAEIIPQGTIMIGSPTETIEDINMTRQFIRDTEIQNTIGICITTAFPGTKLWEYCIEKNLIPESFSWSDFNYQKIPIQCCESISPEDLQNIYYEMVDEFSQGRKLSFEDELKKAIQHPLITLRKVWNNPSKVFKTLKRMN